MTNSLHEQYLAMEKERDALKTQVNELNKSLELHIKVLGDLYPDSADNIDGDHISEFMAVHGLIIETKALLSKTPEQCLNSVKADSIGDAMQKFRYEFEGPRDTDSIEYFFDDIEAELRK